MDQNLVTDRLLLRLYIESDFEAFVKMHSDPILKANTHGKAMNRLQARDLFDGYNDAFAKNNFGMMNIRSLEDDADIGECGLWFRKDAGGYTLRYTVLKDHWAQGYSLEAVGAVLKSAFEVYDLKHVQAIAMNHNVRSMKVLERAGFVQTGNSFRDIHGFLRFVLTQTHWQKLNN